MNDRFPFTPEFQLKDHESTEVPGCMKTIHPLFCSLFDNLVANLNADSSGADEHHYYQINSFYIFSDCFKKRKDDVMTL